MSTERIAFRAASLWRLFLPLALLVLLSVLVNREAWLRTSWTIYAVLAGTLLFLVTGHFLMRRYYYLELTGEGLMVATLGRKRFFPWREIDDVDFARRDIDTAASAHVVLLKLRQASALRKIVGGDVSLLAVYERSPAEIVEILRGRLQTS